MRHSRFEQLQDWFVGLALADRLRIMSATCCANPNPTMGEDIVTGAPVALCGNCGAQC